MSSVKTPQYTMVEAELRRIEAEHVQRTGKKLDSVALSIVRPIVENTIQQKIQFDQALTELTRATDKVDTSQRPFHSDDRWTAFCHGLGRSIPVGVAAIIVAVLSVIIYSQSTAYQNYVNTVETMPNYKVYSDFIKTAQLINREAGVYISLPPGKTKQGEVGYYYTNNCKPPGRQAAPILIPLRYN